MGVVRPLFRKMHCENGCDNTCAAHIISALTPLQRAQNLEQEVLFSSMVYLVSIRDKILRMESRLYADLRREMESLYCGQKG